MPDSSPATLQASYTIIGTTAGPLSRSFDFDTDIDLILSGTGNQTNVDPLLGALVDNGGPTPTHALPVGSPAVDTGDPKFVSPPVTDQRTPPYLRVVDGNGDMVARIDIGAFEVQPDPGPFLLGDYNLDGIVDAADYTVWRDTLGQSAMPFSGADGDGSGVIDQPDYDVWKADFGNTLPPGSAAIASASIQPPDALSTPISESRAMASSIEQPVDAAPRESKYRGMSNVAQYFSGAATSEILELALIDSKSNPHVTKPVEDFRTAFVRDEQVEAAAVESMDEFFAELDNDHWQHVVAAIG